MRIQSPYSHPHNWLKCNLHAHTTLSDGLLEPAEIIERYRRDAYDVLAITDHRRLFSGAGELGSPMVLSGAEFNTDPVGVDHVHHIVGLFVTEEAPAAVDAGEIINAIARQGGFSIVAHPRWSWLPYEAVDSLDGLNAIEVYNGGCQKEVGRGFSTDYWDRYMTLNRRPLWAVAVDDTHACTYDFGTGWTMVNASRDGQSLHAALVAGDFYATSGPRIETIRVDESSITLHTSSARAVKFISTDGRVLESVEGEHVKVASYRPSGDEVYIRAEVHGHDGAVAWTNPFFIEP